MSTTLLYHGFGIRGYRYVRTEFIDGAVVFQVEQEPNGCDPVSSVVLRRIWMIPC